MSEPRHDEFLSIGAAAQALGVSPAGIRKWEKLGVIPPAARLVGSDRRLYRLEDVEVIRQRVRDKRAARRQQGDRVPVA